MRRNLLTLGMMFFASAIFADASRVEVSVDGRLFRCAQGTDQTEVSTTVFGEPFSCRVSEGSAGSLVSRRCECIDNNGPDLMQVGFFVPPYQEKWRTKIAGWDNTNTAWDECYSRARTAPACSDRSNAWVARRCECIENNGPDLMQIGYDTQSGAQLWRSKVGGWNSSNGNWQLCWNAIQSDSACN